MFVCQSNLPEFHNYFWTNIYCFSNLPDNVFLTGPRAKPFRFPDLEIVTVSPAAAELLTSKPVIFTQKPVVFTPRPRQQEATAAFTTTTTPRTTTATTINTQQARSPKSGINNIIKDDILELFGGVPTGAPGMALDPSSVNAGHNDFKLISNSNGNFFSQQITTIEQQRPDEPVVFRAPAPVPSTPVVAAQPELNQDNSRTRLNNPSPAVVNSRTRTQGRQSTRRRPGGGRQRRPPPGRRAPVRNSFNNFIKSTPPISEHFKDEVSRDEVEEIRIDPGKEDSPVGEGPPRKTFTFRIPKTVAEPKPTRSFSYVFNILGEGQGASSFAYNVTNNKVIFYMQSIFNTNFLPRFFLQF